MDQIPLGNSTGSKDHSTIALFFEEISEFIDAFYLLFIVLFPYNYIILFNNLIWFNKSILFNNLILFNIFNFRKSRI